jgi:poly(hydroxyalkanoate) depolymerase family esterase
MNQNFQRLMNEATRLTRAGDLQAATAAIQAALAGRDTPVPPQDDATVIDVESRVMPVAADRSTPATGLPDAYAPGRGAPGDDRFVAGSHTGAAGRRDYKLYIPPVATPGPRPLVVMLHGCTQDPDDFAAGTAMNELARTHGCFVLYPAQSQKANPRRCWNWFKHNHQRRDRGEPALLAGMTREIVARHPIDAHRVYVAGLSAGGAMAAILGDAYPDLYAAVGVHSGLAAGAASDLPTALAAMKNGGRASSGTPGGRLVPTIVFHGDADAIVHPANAEHVVAASAGAPAAVEVHRSTSGGGRACTRHVHRGDDGRVLAEHWVVHGAPHAWSGGRPQGTYTDPPGPDASAQMLRFFLEASARARH